MGDLPTDQNVRVDQPEKLAQVALHHTRDQEVPKITPLLAGAAIEGAHKDTHKGNQAKLNKLND